MRARRILFLLPLVLLGCGSSDDSTGLRPAIRVPADQPTIQAAIAAANDGDLIAVSPGLYHERLDFLGKDVVVQSTTGAAFTTLDGGGVDTMAFAGLVRFSNGEGSGARLEGFTLRNGRGTDFPDGRRGGAILCEGSSPTIDDCVFLDNRAARGGAIACVDSGVPVITDCTFQRDSADAGGAIGAENARPRILRCTFQGNGAAQIGGAVWLRESDATITNCDFLDNRSITGLGGGLGMVLSSPVVTGCLFARNVAARGGAVIVTGTSSAHFIGCTMVDSRVTLTMSGALDVDGDSSADVSRSILAFTDGGMGVTCVGTAVVRISCVDSFGNSGGDTICTTDLGGSFTADPQFCDRASGDYRLLPTSPCLPAQHPLGDDCGTIGARAACAGSIARRGT